jgi:hypothetical protein
MARAPSTFRQQDVVRALKAATTAGVPIARIEIDKTGKITIVIGEPATAADMERRNEWDSV